MKENSSNELAIAIRDSIREKITLLTNLGFVWKEIAVLTDLPKRLIKEFAKGTDIPSVANSPLKEEDLKWLENQVDEAIKRLRSCAEQFGNEIIPENDSERVTRKGHTVDIQSISFYTIKEKNDIVIKLEGIKFST
ncbi:hypothetical protein [Niastella sp. OAS944]|uniref:hypothetical protein n=1 Tax=Niastella sp. OAS944 TaxID=2664089 RepID=UPI00347C95B6|nr:hypothetical protein [Chitinophagaceae bacterium OAS944]